MLRSSDEKGQVAPAYVVVVASLLFLALAFFAVGQAGATRNSAQTGADAAALAAAKQSRDQFELELPANLDPEFLTAIFDLGQFGSFRGCEAAYPMAERNDTVVTPGGCSPAYNGGWGFTVEVETRKPVGDTVLPGTETKKATAKATAALISRCRYEPVPEPLGTLTCEGTVPWLVGEGPPPDGPDLFDIRLAEN
ncbi:pilus assembly protein TadG-related protein [Streptomyces tirandamycinicus]|uniref:pilus assembly protein TadG-related protein n=1 Tax=Streptomyces tirandamycinicus TaxID=2174846 RepID=UPI002272001B|nr:pilus assembly protein TadG-related protein [Streptomyces tirandamycinicus]MCY0982908.1 pilus assembly protein TadG-related protein [Streptomyces tirandamycinicus]